MATWLNLYLQDSASPLMEQLMFLMIMLYNYNFSWVFNIYIIML